VTELPIIIVSWNVRELLARCLTSIRVELDRSNLAGRIIVVDNASHDGSPEMVRERFPQVELIALDENLGFAKGNNIGLRRVPECEYVLLLKYNLARLRHCWRRCQPDRMSLWQLRACFTGMGRFSTVRFVFRG
jgi:glycosyltransferase involved in cell wall biosynthesis